MKKFSICLFSICCVTPVLADHHFVITKETPHGKEIFEENVQNSRHTPLKVMILQFQNKGPLTSQNTQQIAHLIAQSLGSYQNDFSAPPPFMINFQDKPPHHRRKKHCHKHSHHKSYENNPSQEQETPEISKRTPPSLFQTGHFFDDIKKRLNWKDKVPAPLSLDQSGPSSSSQPQSKEESRKSASVHNLAPLFVDLFPTDFPTLPLTVASDVFQPFRIETQSEKSPNESDTEKSSLIPQTPEKNALENTSFDIFQGNPFDEFLE